MAESDYSLLSQWLHRLALDFRPVGEIAWDLENGLYGKSLPEISGDEHVFVAGLARSGSTVLLRRLHASGAFRSLCYRDMPFVLMPNLWARINQQNRAGPLKERAHGDRIRVNEDSPEALEEIFWQRHCRELYLRDDRLIPMKAEPDTLEQFRRYVGLLLLQSGHSRYLSKNNNNILRLPDIRAAFPSAHIIVPYRDPLTHAASLLNQHKRFAGAGRFTRKYMGWLAHHEFGSGHRPFHFPGMENPTGDPFTLDYWLERWIDAYTWLLPKVETLHLILFGYEDFCLQTKEQWEKLRLLLSLPQVAEEPEAITLPPKSPSWNDAADPPRRAAQAYDLYEEMQGLMRCRL